MKISLCSTATLLAAGLLAVGEEPYPNVREVSKATGWQQREARSKQGEREFIWDFEDEEKYLQASDLNGDGKIDYLRLQKPPDSFNHFVWLDTDRDGFFDKKSVNQEGKCHIAVPKLGAFPEVKPPFELFEAKGEAHPLLSEALHWSKSRGLGFDMMVCTEFRRYDGRFMSHWSRKDPPKDRPELLKAQGGGSTTSKQRHRPYRAWTDVIRYGDVFETYKLDPEHRAMFQGVLVPVGENAWFEGQVRLPDRHDEAIYRFDRSPFEHGEGMVTETRITLNSSLDEMPQKSVTRQSFSVNHQTGSDCEVWVITIGKQGSGHHLYRIKWHNGPEVFSSDNGYLNGYWKATLRHELLRREVNMKNAESVGRHFLQALANGNRKKAEALIVPDKGFWNGVTEDDFPFEDGASSALRKTANGELKTHPDPHKSLRMAHLEIGDIPLTLTQGEAGDEWKVLTGYLLSSRHLTGVLRFARWIEALEDGR